MNYIYESEGKNRAEAEKRALELLNLDPGQVSIRPVGAKKGLLGFVSKKPSMVRVYPESDDIPLEAIVTGVVLTLIKKMGMDAHIDRIYEEEGNLHVNLSSEDSRILIGKQGRTLDALQFILNLIVDNHHRKGKRVMVDIAQYKSRRQKRLIKLAKSIADRVAKTRRSVLLEYMNPYDRRIVHLALEEDERVYTKSDGTGVYKRIRVIAENARNKNQSSEEVYEEPDDIDDDYEDEDYEDS